MVCRLSAALLGLGVGVMPPRPSMSPPTFGIVLLKQVNFAPHRIVVLLYSKLLFFGCYAVQAGRICS